MKAVIIFMSILYTTSVYSQTVIRVGTEFKAKGIISTKGSVINASDKTPMPWFVSSRTNEMKFLPR